MEKKKPGAKVATMKKKNEMAKKKPKTKGAAC